MAPQLSGVHHVAICVDDVDAARTFYIDVLGCEERTDRPDFGFPGAWLDTAGGQQVHLIEGTVPTAVGQHFALVFDDLPRTVAALRARGVEVSDWVPVGETGRKQAFMSDPWGNGIELHERP